MTTADSNQQRYRLKLAYDGFGFCGWQVQPNGLAIQEVLKKALETITRQPTYPVAAGRTDAGVHAKGQIVHFDLTTPLTNLTKTMRSLNGLLPPTIRVLGLEACSSKFHARYSAKRKIYHYFLHTDPVESPFENKYRWFVRQAIDLDILQQACSLLQGTHDFKALANENHKGAAAEDSIRTLYRVDAVKIEGGIRLEFEGDGFLYKMVRNCTGLIVEVARHWRPIEDIPLILNQHKRTALGLCAPAHGLFLSSVVYNHSDVSPSQILVTE